MSTMKSRGLLLHSSDMRNSERVIRQDVDPDLVDGQKYIQADRRRIRSMDDYGVLLLAATLSRVARFISARTGAVNFAQFLTSLAATNPNGLWGDLGGGQGIAQRQASVEGLARGWEFVTVDALDWDDVPMTPEERWDIQHEVAKTIFHAEHCPRLIQADAQHVQLPRPATLLTAVQLWQYLEDKNTALAHWYNLLDDGGLLLVACHEPLESFMLDNALPQQSVLPGFLGVLQANGIAFAYSRAPNPRVRDENMYVLAIERKPGTVLIPGVQLLASWSNGDEIGYLESIYDGTQPPIVVSHIEA